MDLEDFKKHCNHENKTDKEIQKDYYTYKINELKTKLSQTDYKAIKYAECLYTEEEYLPIKEERKLYRDEINKYEQLLGENK